MDIVCSFYRLTATVTPDKIYCPLIFDVVTTPCGVRTYHVAQLI